VTLMTVKDLWLYHDQRYIEAHERLMRESNALFDLLDEMGWKPSTPKEHKSVAAQRAKHKAARTALRELREKLMAARSASTEKRTH
jgi:hypothetical protein